MPPPTTAATPVTTASATASPSSWARGWANMLACRRELLVHGLQVTVLCVLIAFVLSLFRAGTGFGLQLAYSLGTGLTCWLLIDVVRFFVDVDSPYKFPRGWRAPALIVVSVVLSFLVGISLGDSLRGLSTWDMVSRSPEAFAFMAAFSIASGLGISYYFYLRGKSHYLVSALEASQRQQAEAQLKLLQSQLEPHMLFNTLANLRALIATDPPQATAMLDRLNAYLRATLAASRSNTHALSAEFDRLQDYLELMRVRMGTRLHYELDLPNELRDTPVPPLLLQPLVENAIKHGLEPKVSGGRLQVRAQRTGNRLHLQVQDDGLGVSASPAHAQGSSTEGFGLSQVRQRLHTLYGKNATFSIATDAGYTRANVEFPL